MLELYASCLAALPCPALPRSVDHVAWLDLASPTAAALALDNDLGGWPCMHA